MQKQILFLSVIVMLLALSSVQAIPVAEVSTSTAYQTILDSDSATSYLIGTPALIDSLSEHPDYPYPSEYAISNAWTTIGGDVKAFCQVQGGNDVSPTPPENMKSVVASANASNSADWLITSDTLAPGTPVNVSLNITFVGEFEGGAGGAPDTSASAFLSIDGISLYEGSGDRHRDNAVQATGDWIGDFTGGYLNAVDIISFDAVVGQTVVIALALQTEVSIPQAWEAKATVDFADSGSYSFVGAEDPTSGAPLDVTFEIVPEPATFLLLVLGTLPLRKRRA